MFVAVGVERKGQGETKGERQKGKARQGPKNKRGQKKGAWPYVKKSE